MEYASRRETKRILLTESLTEGSNATPGEFVFGKGGVA